MVEYGVKKLITNPTLITGTDDIVKVVDGRSKKTKAFIVPVKYKLIIQKLVKELEFQKWAKDKKASLERTKEISQTDDDLMDIGWESIKEYLDD